MNEDNKELLISQKEAASILGLKTTKQISLMIKDGILNTFNKEGSKRTWLDYNEVFNLPKKLPRPLPEEYIPKLKVNERWKNQDEKSSTNTNV